MSAPPAPRFPRRLACLAAVACVGAPAHAAAQHHGDRLAVEECPHFLDGAAVGFTGLAAEMARLAEVTGAVPQRSRLLLRHGQTGVRASACPQFYGRDDGAPTVRMEPVRVEAVHNSGYDLDRNNGAMWSGRGWSSSLRLGASLRWRGVQLTVAPEIVHQANRPFEIMAPARPDLSQFANGLYGSIDLPQRFGNGAESRVTPGQSSLSVTHRGFEAGVSTENLWAGPALRYPILLSNTAAGFPHLFLGTRDATDVRIGDLAARLFWGWTGESEYFDDDRANDWSGLVGWGLSLRPRHLEWLELGALRTYHYRARSRFDLNPEPVFGFLTPSPTNRQGDELASIFMRAVLPESGAEFFAEWARTDRFASIVDDLLPEPDNSQGYLVGVQKLTRAGPGALRLHAELVHLQEKSELREGRPVNVFYTNGQLRQGHTHQGQLLGAWVGPGADAQFIALDYIRNDGRMLGAFVERVRRHEGTREALDEANLHPFLHDVDLSAGLRLAGTTKTMTMSASFAWHRRDNRQFFEDESQNLRAEVELAWYP